MNIISLVFILSLFQHGYGFACDALRDPFHPLSQQSDNFKLLGLIKTDHRSGVILKKEGETQIVAFKGDVVWGYLLKKIGDCFVELEKGVRRVRLISE